MNPPYPYNDSLKFDSNQKIQLNLKTKDQDFLKEHNSIRPKHKKKLKSYEKIEEHIIKIQKSYEIIQP